METRLYEWKLFRQETGLLTSISRCSAVPGSSHSTLNFTPSGSRGGEPEPARTGQNRVRWRCRISSSYQSEDQVVERRGGQQEQQHGEEQRPDEELEDTKTMNERATLEQESTLCLRTFHFFPLKSLQRDERP
ncbi:hypothetical protein EYF80_062197 [Liparis tanakae]|uniref:Uncharacterized protein n=1 Tax=Liparis tanakae TaxID=230148 RepID=A0A4Z2EFE8_9TELE|nr:hypothetical protein EYF80_062197 [Liparis tanakae]